MNRYELLEEIGHGAYSIVFKAYDAQGNKIVAIKRINHSNPEIIKILNREIQTLSTLHHPNIIKLLDLFRDNVYTYLVFEYLPCDLITFYKQIKKRCNRNLNDEEITYIIWQMCQGIAYMHSNGFIHRDIKPENVLIDPNSLHVKLIDFGFTIRTAAYMPKTQYMITRWYRPLEIVLGFNYDAKADIFALGALLLELYSGQEIFRSSSNIDQIFWIFDVCGVPTGWVEAFERMKQLGIKVEQKKMPKIFKMTQHLREDAQKIIIGMLQANPFYRMSINEILSNSYFSSYQPQRPKPHHNDPPKSLHHQPPPHPPPSHPMSLPLSLPLSLSLHKEPPQLSTDRLPPARSHPTPPPTHRRLSDLTHLPSNPSNPLNSLNPSNPSPPIPSSLSPPNPLKKTVGTLSHSKLGYSSKGANKIRLQTEGNEALIRGGIAERSKGFCIGDRKFVEERKEYGGKELRHHHSEEEWPGGRGLKWRTKSQQGINVISLKKSNSRGGLGGGLGGNPEGEGFREGCLREGYLREGEGKRKEPSFTRIRDKFAVGGKNGRLKMSLTERNHMILNFGKNE